MKWIICSAAIAFIATASAGACGPKGLQDFAKNAEGKELFLSQKNASDYCRSLGGRLPTVRELAEFAVCSGAYGITELKDYDGSHEAALLIRAEGAGGKLDQFYFENVGYKLASKDDGHFSSIFWSSEFFAGYPDFPYGFQFGLGEIVRVPVATQRSVRCLVP